MRLNQETKVPEIDLERQIIVLFDEHGTPTFGPKRDTDCFLGVAVTYDLAKEKEIFSKCSLLFGLSKMRPIKNNQITNSQAERISDLITELPIQIKVKSVNLAHNEFQLVLTLYEQLGNQLRRKHRQVGERNIAQILHFHIREECVFWSIIDYTERHLTSSTFSVYVDNWSMPRDDIEIHLNCCAQSIQRQANSLFEKQGPNLSVSVPRISLLDKDSPRKRFVDAITSVISRSFLRESNSRFSQAPLQRLLTNDINRSEDVTQATIDLIRALMDNVLRNPPSVN